MRQALLLLAMFLAIFSQQALAQQRTITGKVISSQDNLGIPGVSIVIPGTTTGVTTDIDGNFSMTVPDTTKQLRISAVGMKTKDLTLTAENTVSVTLDPDVMKLDEVVVTANAIVREKRSLGYATTQVTSDDLNAGGNTNVIGAMQGKISGVNITSLSGAPGSSNRIVIRGGTSIARNNQALIVVDGIPINNSNNRSINPSDPNGQYDDLNNQVDFGNRANDINPNDIESISVLKGPAATALYGSQASNGAILITTKKGRAMQGGKSKMEVTYNTNLMFSSPLKLPDFQNEFGEGDVDNLPDDRRENFSWGYKFDGKLRPWGQAIDGKQRIKPYSAIEDNVKDFFNVGTTWTNYLSFAGGTEKNSYFLSLGSTNNDGIVPTTEFDKYTVHFAGNSELANHFTAGVNINYTNISSKLPTGGQNNQSVYDQLIQTPRDIPITDGKDLEDPFNKYDDVTGTYGFYAGYTMNPYFVLANYKNFNKVDRVFGNISISYSQWKWLTITDRLGGDIYSDRRTQRWKKYDYAPIDQPYYSLHQTYQGKYLEDNYNFNNLNNDLMFQFSHSFNENIKATLLLGQNIRQNTLTQIYAQTNDQGGLALPDYYNLQNSNGRPLTLNSLTETRNIGYYADFNISYKNYLFLGLTGRQDQSSTLPTDNNTYFYPGVNASFVFSELFSDNLKEDKWTYGKIRASWAKVGNDATAYITSNTFEQTAIDAGFGSTQFPFNNVIGYSVGDRLGNQQLKPEFTTAFEVGTELGFLKDRLAFDFSYYQNKSTDQIIPLPVAYSSGYSTQYINTGEIKNNGIELAVRGTPVMSKSGFKVELYGTYTKNESEVVSLYKGVEQLTLGGHSRLSVVAQVGQPYGAFYAVDLLRDPQGHVVVDSASGMPQLTTNQVYVGNYQPDFQASFGSNISWKGFKLNFLFDMKQGGVFYSRTKSLMDFIGTGKETVVNDREDYVWANSVYKSSADNGGYVANTTPFHPYDYYTSVIPEGQMMVDASYVKLRELSLSYTLPSKWLNKTPFGTATVTLIGNNLFIWTPEENQYSDPEQNSSGSSNTQGFEYASNISQRNYGVDLKITF